MDPWESAKHRHAEPHPKKGLRMAAWQEMQHDGVYASPVWLTNCTGKLKTNEWAKPGKIPRLIGDLGVVASLEGFDVAERLKGLYQDMKHLLGMRIDIVKGANTEKLTNILRTAAQPPTKYYGAFFSDDGVITIHDGKNTRYFLVDISKCDTSHHSIFKAFVQSTPEELQGALVRCVKQLQRPFVVRSTVDTRVKIKLKQKTGEPTLFSGSTITTAINDFSMINIFRQVILDGATEAIGISEAARKVGYILTVEEVDHCSKLQFLKHSPVRCADGRLHAVLNPGVFLRASGVCKGDLPILAKGKEKKDLAIRAAHFQRALLQGMYPRISCPFVDNCKRSTGISTPDEAFTSLIQKEMAYKTFTREETIVTTDQEFFKRYNLTDSQMADLHQFSAGRYSQFFNTPGLAAVLLLDYGLTTTTRDTDLPRSDLWQR